MFAGFDLHLYELFSDFKERGNDLFKQNKLKVEEELEDFLENDGSIDGTKMQSHWFPQIKADVFISHSHADQEKAIALAGWLNATFGLEVFIDSCVWGYADELLKKLDNNYCWMSDVGSYSYEKRNYSTSHVHMMLSTALTSMIDKSECLVFLNTPNSINTKDVIQQQTKSPWIYMEVMMSQLVRKKVPDREGVLKRSQYEANQKDLSINYQMDTRHLKTIKLEDLNNWKYAYSQSLTKIYSLDVLYKQHDLIKGSSLLPD